MNPSPRLGHTIFRLENTSLCLLIGGEKISSSDSVYALNIDIDHCKASQVVCHIAILLCIYLLNILSR